MARSTTPAKLSTRDRVSVLMEEYRALYGLAEFRMASLDRRVPAAGAVLTTFLGGVPRVPEHTAVLLLVVIPASLIWFLRTTLNHARSFEDALRRIEAIEKAVNTLAGATLLEFQSSHPSRSVTVGGRTGTETIGAVSLASSLLLTAAGVLFVVGAGLSSTLSAVYLVYLASIAGYLIRLLLRFRTYRYQRRS